MCSGCRDRGTKRGKGWVETGGNSERYGLFAIDIEMLELKKQGGINTNGNFKTNIQKNTDMADVLWCVLNSSFWLWRLHG